VVILKEATKCVGPDKTPNNSASHPNQSILKPLKQIQILRYGLKFRCLCSTTNSHESQRNMKWLIAT